MRYRWKIRPHPNAILNFQITRLPELRGISRRAKEFLIIDKTAFDFAQRSANRLNIRKRFDNALDHAFCAPRRADERLGAFNFESDARKSSSFPIKTCT